MSVFSLRYGEPDWNEPPHTGPGLGADIQQRPLSDKSYEELRMDASQKTWATKFADLNATNLTAMASLRNLTEVIEIIVGSGEEQARWVVHQQLLTNDSEFAALALKSNFKEKNENTIRFPEERPDIMEQYVRYLYTGCIVTFSLEHVIQMYCLGDRLQSLKFANACYETVSRTSDSYTATQIKYIFDETYSQDRLRSLAISQVGKGILNGRYTFTSAYEQELLRDYMPELMQGVTAAVAERIRRGDKWYPSFPHTAAVPTPAEPAGMTLEDGSISGNRPQQATGGLFGLPANSGAGLFGAQPANRTSGTGGGLFGNSQPQSWIGNPNNQPQAANIGGLFGNLSQPQSTNTRGGLFGNNNNHSHSTNTGVLFGSNNNQPQPTSTGGLFGNSSQPQSINTGGGLYGNNLTNSLFSGTGIGHSSNNNQQATGGLFGNAPSALRPTVGLLGAPSPADANRGGLIGTSQGSQTIGGFAQQSQSGPPSHGGWTPSPNAAGVFGAGTSQANSFSSVGSAAAPAASSGPGNLFPNQPSAPRTSVSTGRFFSFNNLSNAAVNPSNDNQRHSSAPVGPPRATSSLFGDTSSASPFVAAPAPTGAPVFAFPPPSQQQSSSRAQQPSEERSSDEGEFASNSNTRPNPANTNNDQSILGGDDDDTSILRTQEPNSKRPAFTFDLPQPSRPVFGQQIPLSAGRVVSGGWRPTTNANPPRSIGFTPDAPLDPTQHEEESTNNGKEPASEDGDLSEAFTNLSFPGIGGDMGHLEDFLKNSGGGKVSRDDTLSPGFERYLRDAKEDGKGKGKEDAGLDGDHMEAGQDNHGQDNAEISSPATVVGEPTPESSNDEGEAAASIDESIAITELSNGKVTQAADAEASERARKTLASFGARFI